MRVALIMKLNRRFKSPVIRRILDAYHLDFKENIYLTLGAGDSSIWQTSSGVLDPKCSKTAERRLIPPQSHFFSLLSSNKQQIAVWFRGSWSTFQAAFLSPTVTAARSITNTILGIDLAFPLDADQWSRGALSAGSMLEGQIGWSSFKLFIEIDFKTLNDYCSNIDYRVCVYTHSRDEKKTKDAT